MFLRHPILSLATFAYLGLVGWITLGPAPYDEGTSSLIRRALEFLQRFDSTSWATFSRIEFVANILMFVPIGMFLVLLLGRRSWWAAIVFGVVMSCSIELAQYFWIPTRVADPRDILANGIGTIAGIIGVELVTWPKSRRMRAARSKLQRA